MGGRYYGLVGGKLNLAIGVLAGLDFLLFGYDQGVMGGLLNLPSFCKTFPEIDARLETTSAQHLNQNQINHRSVVQGDYASSINAC